MNKVPTIKSGKFQLRAIDLEKDKESLISNINDSGVMEWLTLTYPYDKKKDWENFIKYLENNKTYYFAIDIDGKQVGSISFAKGSKPVNDKTVEMGFFLAKNHWNNGIMTEAVKLITQFAFDDLKIHKIEVPLFAKDISSQKVLENNGYKLEATLKDHLFKHNAYHDELIFVKFNK